MWLDFTVQHVQHTARQTTTEISDYFPWAKTAMVKAWNWYMHLAAQGLLDNSRLYRLNVLTDIYVINHGNKFPETIPSSSWQSFITFRHDWDVEHLTPSPCHSQSNGRAESAV